MKFIWKTQYLKYIIVVILLLLILYFIYNPSLKEGVTSVSPKENCGDFTIQNRNIMNEITNANIQATGGNINAQINDPTGSVRCNNSLGVNLLEIQNFIKSPSDIQLKL